MTPARLPRTTLTQRWESVAFVHWPIDPAAARPHLPTGVEPDVLGGTTYVGLVAFRMRAIAPLGGPPVPYFGDLCETNVRLYSVDGRGRQGVVFVSMDTDRLLTALVARGAARLPYTWSQMRVARHGRVVHYRCRRRWPGARGATNRMSLRVGEPLPEPSPLERFLTARWALHSTWHGRLLYTPTEHPHWLLHRAIPLDLHDELVAAAGLPRPERPPVSVLWSPGIPARFGWPVPTPSK